MIIYLAISDLILQRTFLVDNYDWLEYNWHGDHEYSLAYLLACAVDSTTRSIASE